MATVLVVDDEAHIREVVQYALGREGHTVVTAASGDEALRRVADGGIDLVVLDIVMPAQLDGLAVCRRLRADGQAVPVIFLSSRAEELDRVLGLELGGDDYLSKPFSPRELVARVAAVLRRTSPPAAPPERRAHGRLLLDPASRELTVDGQPVELTVTEFDLLRLLLEQPGRVYTRAQIIDAVRADDVHITERTIDSHVRRIRAKLRRHGLDPIETVHGLGYKVKSAPAR
jgi:two-component system OmpR family response regulator